MSRSILSRNQFTLACSLMAGIFLASEASLDCRAESPLVSRTAAAQAGLERAWFAQLGVDPARSEVTAWTLHFDSIFGVTNSGMAFALDANTGQQMWIRQIGKMGHPAFGPGANEKYVGIVSGSQLYLLDRNDGRLIWSRELGSAPGAGPALTEKYAFVVTLTGLVEAYNLDDPETQPWYYNSRGRAFLRPVTTGRVVSWPTSAGLLYVSRAEDPGLLYRVETNAEIVAAPAEMDHYLYVASLDGNLYCIEELSGEERWRFSTGYAIVNTPAVVGKHAYVASREPSIHAIETATGRELWEAHGATQFAAEGKSRVYAADGLGNLIVLDTESGARLATVNTAEGVTPLVNDQTDRIFLINKRGLVQCLHEIGVNEPLYHRQKTQTEEVEEQPVDENPFAAEAAPADEEAPAEVEARPADEEVDETPAETNDVFDDFNPFGEP